MESQWGLGSPIAFCPFPMGEFSVWIKMETEKSETVYWFATNLQSHLYNNDKMLQTN